MNYYTFGNKEILKYYKIAFFCSKLIPPNLITNIYDYFIKLRNESITIISGFHTQIERDVLKFLLKGKQPIIICPARSVQKISIKPELKDAFNNNRLLFISPFKNTDRRITKELSLKRNLFITQIADEIVIAHASKEGSLEKIIKELQNSKKIKKTFSSSHNQNLIDSGFEIIN